MSRDEFKDATFDHVWTPPHGTHKMLRRRRARKRIAQVTRRLIDFVLSKPSVREHAQRDDEDRVYCDCPIDQHVIGCPWRQP